MNPFEPRQISSRQAEVWQRLIGSRHYLDVSAFGKKWRFQFVLELTLQQDAITSGIQLGSHPGIIQWSILPQATWMRSILKGSEIESLQEPFRTAVLGVILEDFFQGLSKSSQLSLRLVESSLLPTMQPLPLYWQLLNDQGEAEIIGSLTAEEKLISEICATVSHWPISPWNLSDSFPISVDVLIGSLSLSTKERASLEIGDTLLLGDVQEWEKEPLLLRIVQGKGKESLIVTKFPRSTLESKLFS